MSGEDDRTVWVGNLDDKVNEEILYELFLQAGPLEYVRHPKDKVSGRKKNFAFVCFRHDCSVPYAIALMNEIKLCGRNMKVQSRHLQELQAQGLASYNHGGIHTLDPIHGGDPTAPAAPPAAPQGCHQEAGLLGQVPSSLLGNIPGNIPAHILALAQQQMALLNANQPVPLSQNPSLNARMRPRDDRYGSINYGRNSSNSGEQSHQEYNRYQDYRGRGGRGPQRHMDNKMMQAMKSRSEDAVAQNSEMLAGIQERQGRFDKSRLGPRGNNNYDDSRYQQDRGGHHRSNNRDFRQQPYDRSDSHHSRNHDRQSSHDNRRRFDDRNSGGRNRNNGNDRYERDYYSPQYGSRR